MDHHAPGAGQPVGITCLFPITNFSCAYRSQHAHRHSLAHMAIAFAHHAMRGGAGGEQRK